MENKHPKDAAELVATILEKNKHLRTENAALSAALDRARKTLQHHARVEEEVLRLRAEVGRLGGDI